MRVVLINSCRECTFHNKHDNSCNHPKMSKANDVDYQVYLSWYEGNMDADGFPADCPFPTEQHYLEGKIMDNITKAWGNM